MLSEILQIFLFVVPASALIIWMAYRFVNKKTSKEQSSQVDSTRIKKAAVAGVIANTIFRR